MNPEITPEATETSAPSPATQPGPELSVGSLDGQGAGDHDQPFIGFRPYHFNTRQLARLLLLRGEALEARLGSGRWAQDLKRPR
jgi:hypothetical protein